MVASGATADRLRRTHIHPTVAELLHGRGRARRTLPHAENAVGCRNALSNELISAPFRSVSTRFWTHSGSVENACYFS